MASLLDSLQDIEISYQHRRVIYYGIGIVAVVVLYSLAYNFGMRTFEGHDHSIFRSFQTVVETMTTTGYGADAPWDSWVMNAFIVFMQLTGIGIGFFTLRLVIIPLFTGAELNLDRRLSPKSNHVIICEYRRDSAVLLDELRALDIEYVLIVSDEENAKDLSDEGYSVIHGSPQDTEAFERASIDTAHTVITDAGDANVDTILTVRSLRSDIEIVTLTDDSDLESVLLETGADSVLSPHGVLGHRLASKAVESITSELVDTVELGGDIEVTEIPIPHHSQLIGVRIRDSGIREETGANIIAAWIDGELQLPPHPDAVIRHNTVLLVSGSPDSLEELSQFTRPGRTFQQHDRIVLAGLGEVGKEARSVITEAGIDTVTIDVEARDDVDVVGDASSQETLEAAGVEDAGAIVVGLPNDSESLLATVLSRKLNSDIEALVRVSETDATGKAMSAGADYVLSVPRVSARMIAKEIRGEEILEPASQIRLIQVPATPFAGSTLAGSSIYEKTGCRVIAIGNDERMSSAVDPERVLSADDELTLVGTDESIQSFLQRFDVSPTAVVKE